MSLSKMLLALAFAAGVFTLQANAQSDMGQDGSSDPSYSQPKSTATGGSQGGAQDNKGKSKGDMKGGTKSKGQSKDQGGAQGGTMQMQRMTGTVQTVNADNNSISVQDNTGMTKDIRISSDAKIMKDNNAAAITDITPGDKVTIMYTGSMDNPMVKEVTVTSGK